MIAVALLFDGVDFLVEFLEVLNLLIPGSGALAVIVVSALISVWAWLTFYLWFKLHGVSFVSPKRALTMPIAFIIKIIPVIGALPAWTLAVFLLFMTIRGEELLLKALSKTETGARIAGKVGAVAGKVPGISGATRQGFKDISQRAENIAEKAKGTRERLQNRPGLMSPSGGRERNPQDEQSFSA